MGFADNTIAQLKTAANNFVGSALGLANQTQNTASPAILPWNNVSNKFFAPMDIDPKRWDQLFPYRLVVVDSQGQIINGGDRGSATPTFKNKDTAEYWTSTEGSNTILNFTPMTKSWVFRLPITPQQLTITDQFAINTSATLRGILEEHNAVKFKLISASGTMGLWAQRSSVTVPVDPPTGLLSVFAGTIESATNVVNQFSRVLNSASGAHPANKPKTLKPVDTPAGETSTGYYQSLALQQFLEQYAAAKLLPQNAGIRLVFDIPKQNQSFVVTPIQFLWSQSENKPSLINYAFQLKAWRRINLKDRVGPVSPSVQPLSVSVLQRILSTISEARRLTSASIDLIGAVRSDVERPLDVLRQLALFVKEAGGMTITAADLPFQIQKEYASSIEDSMNIMKDSINSVSNDPSVRKQLELIGIRKLSVEGLSLAAVAGGQLGSLVAHAQSIDPANNIFKQPERNFSLINNIPLSSMSLNNAQNDKVDNILDSARNISISDIKDFRSVIQDLALQLSNNFGAGSAYYSSLYNRPVPNVRISPMTLSEYEILQSLYNVMESCDILTATTNIDDEKKQTNMDYVLGLADQSGIQFSNSTSKILVPVPFGLSIERIAARYLRDPQRWLEIATLNNLRVPYIDENGFNRYLTSNATGRQLTINNIEDMFVGQRIVIRSATQTPVSRRILEIDRLSDTSYLLTLDGDVDLDAYKIADSAYIQAYLPGTVNSQQKIFIPSDVPVPADTNISVPTSVSGDPLVGLSKVDWLLTDTGDLAVNTFGDVRLSSGLTNLIQAIKIKLGTPRNSVLLHPTFGIGLKPGMSNSDLDVQEIYNSITSLVEADSRFAGLDSLQIQLNGPTLSVSMSVIIAGQNGIYPITFTLGNG